MNDQTNYRGRVVFVKNPLILYYSPGQRFFIIDEGEMFLILEEPKQYSRFASEMVRVFYDKQILYFDITDLDETDLIAC